MAYAVKPTENLENQPFAEYVVNYRNASHFDEQGRKAAPLPPWQVK
jgi:hypothetical protein